MVSHLHRCLTKCRAWADQWDVQTIVQRINESLIRRGYVRIATLHLLSLLVTDAEAEIQMSLPVAHVVRSHEQCVSQQMNTLFLLLRLLSESLQMKFFFFYFPSSLSLRPYCLLVFDRLGLL